MEQNNFEKKIQQKLDELKIPPSDAVWENVEKNINKRKDRKKILIFFLLFAGLASGGYFIFKSMPGKEPLQKQLVSTPVDKDSKQTKKKDSSFNETAVSGRNDSEKNNIPGANSTTNKTRSRKMENHKAERKQTNAISTIKDRSLAEDSKNKNNKGTEPVVLNKKILLTSEHTNNSKNDLAINSQGKFEEKNTVIVTHGAGNVPDKIPETQLEEAIQQKEIPATDSQKIIAGKTGEPANQIRKSSEVHKWRLGVTFSGGTSMIGDGSVPGGTNLSSFARMDFVSLPSPANNYALSSFNNYFTPSPIENSMAFIGGVFIEKNISRKNKIDLGISYKYYSLVNTTGNKIDYNIDPSLSAQSLYSSWSNINTYRNNFHYIEIPISLKFQLGNSETLPIYWSAGVSISQLISSNSLQFKSVPGLYYKDNSLYNKTQVGLQTGFSALLFAKAKVPINIGPYFIYNTSKLANDGLYGGKHFSFIGIKTEILLGKK